MFFEGTGRVATCSNASAVHAQPSVGVIRLASCHLICQGEVAKRQGQVQRPRVQTCSLGLTAMALSSTGSSEQKIRIKLKAFELPLLKQSVSHILQAAETTG